eukprot:scaffold919_cov153-Ochromonas_danica.AAC.2
MAAPWLCSTSARVSRESITWHLLVLIRGADWSSEEADVGAIAVDEGFIAEEVDLSGHELLLLLSDRILKTFLRSVTSSDIKQIQGSILTSRSACAALSNRCTSTSAKSASLVFSPTWKSSPARSIQSLSARIGVNSTYLDLF